MPTINELVLDKQYSDLNVPTEAILDAAYGSIVTYVNDLKDKLLSVTKDALGSDYEYPANGDAAFTNSLFEKQFVSKTYTGGDISIGNSADVSYASVDAINAAVSITPERTGYYKATFVFTHYIEMNNTTEGIAEVSFRITDGVTASQAVLSGAKIPAAAAGACSNLNPITLVFIFNWSDTGTKTIQLQKKVTQATNIQADQVLASTTGSIQMYVEKL